MRLTIFFQEKTGYLDLVSEGNRDAAPRVGELVQIQDGRVFKVVSVLHRVYTDAVDVVVEL